MRNEDAERGRALEVWSEMPIRIHQERDTFVRVGDEIGSVTEARVEELLEEHRFRLWDGWPSR
jgi:hypothetical protein